MDPLTVLSTLWRHKWTAIPVIVLTLAACAYVYLFAPRSYEASMSYALAAPQVPSEFELEQNKDLAKLNSDNPYLRTGDSSLLSQVVIVKLSDPEVVASLEAAGLGTDYTIAPVANLGMGLVQITASANSEQVAVDTAQALGEKFKATIKSVQEINHADATYLYSAMPVRGPGPATELYSSRLRSLIMVGIAGAVLLFGVVSVAQSVTIRKAARRNEESESGSREQRIGVTRPFGSMAPQAPLNAQEQRSGTGLEPLSGNAPNTRLTMETTQRDVEREDRIHGHGIANSLAPSRSSEG